MRICCLDNSDVKLLEVFFHTFFIIEYSPRKQTYRLQVKVLINIQSIIFLSSAHLQNFFDYLQQKLITQFWKLNLSFWEHHQCGRHEESLGQVKWDFWVLFQHSIWQVETSNKNNSREPRETFRLSFKNKIKLFWDKAQSHKDERRCKREENEEEEAQHEKLWINLLTESEWRIMSKSLFLSNDKWHYPHLWWHFSPEI